MLLSVQRPESRQRVAVSVRNREVGYFCCQSSSYLIADAVNNEGVSTGPTQGPYILQLCVGPSYFWGVWPILTHPLFRTLVLVVITFRVVCDITVNAGERTNNYCEAWTANLKPFWDIRIPQSGQHYKCWQTMQQRLLLYARRDVYGNGEDWDPAADLGMACSARVYVLGMLKSFS